MIYDRSCPQDHAHLPSVGSRDDWKASTASVAMFSMTVVVLNVRCRSSHTILLLTMRLNLNTFGIRAYTIFVLQSILFILCLSFHFFAYWLRSWIFMTCFSQLHKIFILFKSTYQVLSHLHLRSRSISQHLLSLVVESHKVIAIYIISSSDLTCIARFLLACNIRHIFIQSWLIKRFAG